jgi:hypothetical protein
MSQGLDKVCREKSPIGRASKPRSEARHIVVPVENEQAMHVLNLRSYTEEAGETRRFST